jgi:hypothetical protein
VRTRPRAGKSLWRLRRIPRAASSNRRSRKYGGALPARYRYGSPPPRTARRLAPLKLGGAFAACRPPLPLRPLLRAPLKPASAAMRSAASFRSASLACRRWSAPLMRAQLQSAAVIVPLSSPAFGRLRSLSFQARAASGAPLSSPASRGLRSLRHRPSARGLLPPASQNAAHPRRCPAPGRRRPR